MAEVGVSGWAGRGGGGVESRVCSIGKGCVVGGGVGCGGFQSGSGWVVMCSLVGGVTCVVALSADLLRLRIQGEYEEGVACCGLSII